MQDLAPHIYRQRLVVEGLAETAITAEDIEKYLSGLSRELDMVELLKPVTHRSDMYGWAGGFIGRLPGPFLRMGKPRLL